MVKYLLYQSPHPPEKRNITRNTKLCGAWGHACECYNAALPGVSRSHGMSCTTFQNQRLFTSSAPQATPHFFAWEQKSDFIKKWPPLHPQAHSVTALLRGPAPVSVRTSLRGHSHHSSWKCTFRWLARCPV